MKKFLGILLIFCVSGAMGQSKPAQQQPSNLRNLHPDSWVATAVWFYAETAKPLTSSKDPNWMLLFIDTDQNKATGWEGYDLVINSEVINQKTTTVKWLNKDGSTGKSVHIPYQVSGNKLMVSVKRLDVGPARKLSFDYHWADNIQKIGDITEFFLNGDNAPERRANYRFQQ